MSEWISVEDRLPEDGSLVVAAKFYEYIDEPDAAVCNFYGGRFLASDDALNAENHDGGAMIRLDVKPTHWVELPHHPSPPALAA